MLTVKDADNKFRCARCNCVLKKTDIVKDRFLPRSCSSRIQPDLNYIGVCSSCHKLRLKQKVVMPNYWRFLNKEQKENLTRFMVGVRNDLMCEADVKIAEQISLL